MENEDGLASGSGEDELHTQECRKYNQAIVSHRLQPFPFAIMILFFQYSNSYGDKCVNHYILRRDVRQVCNIIALLHKCKEKPDADFYKKLMGVEQGIVNSASSLLSCKPGFLYTPI